MLCARWADCLPPPATLLSLPSMLFAPPWRGCDAAACSEGELQNPAVGSHQPAGRAGEGDAPVSRNLGQLEPGGALVRSPGRAALVCGDDDRANEIVSGTHIAQAVNRAGDGRRVGQRPSLAAVMRDGSGGV